jgi:hypothetical protein
MLLEDIKKGKRVPLHVLDDDGLRWAREIAEDERMGAVIEYGELRALRPLPAERSAEAHQRAQQWPSRRYQ